MKHIWWHWKTLEALLREAMNVSLSKRKSERGSKGSEVTRRIIKRKGGFLYSSANTSLGRLHQFYSWNAALVTKLILTSDKNGQDYANLLTSGKLWDQWDVAPLRTGWHGLYRGTGEMGMDENRVTKDTLWWWWWWLWWLGGGGGGGGGGWEGAMRTWG